MLITYYSLSCRKNLAMKNQNCKVGKITSKTSTSNLLDAQKLNEVKNLSNKKENSKK